MDDTDKAVKELLQAVKAGLVSPAQAVEKFEHSATHIKDIPIDNLKVDVLDCGFPTLNEYMFFKQGRGELLILGARPSVGKSAFMFQVASHVATRHNVLIFSLEMDKESIKARMLAAVTGQGLNRILKGEVPDAKLKEGSKQLDRLNYHIDDRSGLEVKALVSSALDFNRKFPLALVVIDYLQLVKSGNRASRNEEVGDVSLELKQLAKRLKCPVLAAAQLNRKCIDRGNMMLANGKRPNYIPEMGDLRESGNIEQDADGILFLSRHEVFAPGQRVGEVDISIAKQRNGPTGNETFRWLGASTRFLDIKGEEI